MFVLFLRKREASFERSPDPGLGYPARVGVGPTSNYETS